jgi:hypothetical protein
MDTIYVPSIDNVGIDVLQLLINDLDPDSTDDLRCTRTLTRWVDTLRTPYFWRQKLAELWPLPSELWPTNVEACYRELVKNPGIDRIVGWFLTADQLIEYREYRCQQLLVEQHIDIEDITSEEAFDYGLAVRDVYLDIHEGLAMDDDVQKYDKVMFVYTAVAPGSIPAALQIEAEDVWITLQDDDMFMLDLLRSPRGTRILRSSNIVIKGYNTEDYYLNAVQSPDLRHYQLLRQLDNKIINELEVKELTDLVLCHQPQHLDFYLNEFPEAMTESLNEFLDGWSKSFITLDDTPAHREFVRSIVPQLRWSAETREKFKTGAMLLSTGDPRRYTLAIYALECMGMM